MQHTGFLQAICEAPDDDGPRLIYADWLDDHGQAARAEFIRLQCRRATLDPDAAEQRGLHRRECELLAAHADAWLAELPKLQSGKWGRCGPGRLPHFERGFVSAVEFGTVTAFLKQFDALLAAAPVRRVALGKVVPTTVRMLMQWQGLSRLRGLVVRGCDSADELVRRLAEWGHAGNLEHLDLSHPNDYYTETGAIGPNLSGPAVQALGSFSALRSLDLSHHACAAEQVEALAAAGGLPRLQRLQLGPVRYDVMAPLGNVLGGGDLRWLAVSTRVSDPRAALGPWLAQPAAERLTRLSLDHFHVGYSPRSQLVNVLTESAGLRNLRALDLRKTQLIQPERLAAAGNLSGLRFLRLGNSFVSKEAQEALANSTVLGDLRELHLDWTKLDVALARFLADRTGLPRLELLAVVTAVPTALKLLRERCPALEIQASSPAWRSPYFWTNPQRE